MTVNLQKGQKVDLTKSGSGLNNILIGLGWDPVKKSGRGILSSLFGIGNGPAFDVDASVIMLNEQSKLAKKDNVVYYGNLKDPSGSVMHMGDNLTGEGEGDDEQIKIDLNRVPNDIHHLIFVVNIYDCKSKKQDFGSIENAYIRVANGTSGQELMKFDLTENYAGKTALIAGEVYRYSNEWKFAAIGEGTNDGSLSEMVRKYM